jgi:hypothetical protein
MARTLLGVSASLVAAGLLLEACAQVPPAETDDLCAMFAERPSWQAAAAAAAARWEVNVGTILAVVHQESRFHSTARPGWQRAFGVIPVGPRSSAYGYGQVKDGTWSDYQERARRPLARRDRFDDVADFIGWYADVIHRSAGVDKGDTFRIYLGYHEGPSGYQRRSFDAKPWLLGVARKVDDQAQRYGRQYASCGGPEFVESRR